MHSPEKTLSNEGKKSSDEILQSPTDFENTKVEQTKTKSKRLVKKQSKESVANKSVDEEQLKDKSEIKPPESGNVRLLHLSP